MIVLKVLDSDQAKEALGIQSPLPVGTKVQISSIPHGKDLMRKYEGVFEIVSEGEAKIAPTENKLLTKGKAAKYKAK